MCIERVDHQNWKICLIPEDLTLTLVPPKQSDLVLREQDYLMVHKEQPTAIIENVLIIVCECKKCRTHKMAEI